MSDLGDISLGGVPYRIDLGSYNKRDVSDVSPRASVPGGSVVYSDLTLFQPFVQTDWRHGFGAHWYTDAAAYMSTIGSVDTRHPSLGMLYTTSVESDTDGHPKFGFTLWNDDVYSYSSDGIRKYSFGSTGHVWTDVYNGDVNYLLPTNNYLFMLTNGGRVYYSTDGTPNEDGYSFNYTTFGSNKDVAFTAKVAGVAGNSITVAYVVDGVAGSETVTLSGSDVTVHIGAGSTATQIVAAVNNVAKWTGTPNITAALRSGSSGAGAPGVMTAIRLNGGGGLGRAAELLTDEGTNANLKFVAKTRGSAGNSITVAYLDKGSGTERADVSGSDIKVYLTPASSTASDVMKLILADVPTYATATTSTSGVSNTGIVYTAKVIGEDGNNIQITYRISSVPVGSETAVVTASSADSNLKIITVSLNKNSKAAHVIDAINGTTASSALVTAANATSSSGSGIIIPASATTSWSYTKKLSGGASKDVTDLVTVNRASGNTGAGIPGTMSALALQGGSGKMAWTETGVNVKAKDFKWAIVHNGRVFVGEDGNSMVHYATETDLSDLEATKEDPDYIQVGSDELATLRAIVFAGSLYVAKEDGLWNIGTDYVARHVLDYSSERSRDNFRSMIVWNGYLIYPIRDRLYQWNGSRSADITPPKVTDTFPYTTYGRFDNFVATGGFFYCTARTNETTYDEVLLCFDGVGWHKLVDLVTDSSSSICRAMMYDSVHNYMWYHIQTASTNTTYYIPLQSRSNYPYPLFPTSGDHSIVTSRLDMGFRAIKKSTTSIKLQVDNTSSTRYLLVYYRMDGSDTWLAWGGTDGTTNKIATDGLTELTNPLGTADSSLEYFFIQFKIKFVTGTYNQSPILDGMFMVRFILRPTTYWGWSFNIVMSRDVEYGEHEGDDMPYDIRVALEALRDSVSPIAFVDIYGESRKVYISAINQRGVEDHFDDTGTSPNIELVASVNLVEAA